MIGTAFRLLLVFSSEFARGVEDDFEKLLNGLPMALTDWWIWNRQLNEDNEVRI